MNNLPVDHLTSDNRLRTELAVALALAGATTLKEAMPSVLEAICRASGWDWGGLWEVDRNHETLRWVTHWHDPALDAEGFTDVSRRTTLESGIGLPGRVWASGEAAWVIDVARDENFPRREAAARSGLHGAICFPVLSGGEVLAMMEFFSHEVRPPDEPLLVMMRIIGTQLGEFVRRREAEEALRRGESRQAAVVAAALDCIVSMDHHGRVIEWNAAAERTFGYSRGEALGGEMAELIIPPAYRARHRRGLAMYGATGEGPVIGKRFEIEAMRKGGEEFPVELTIIALSADGPPTFTGFLRDITERKRAQSRDRFLIALDDTVRPLDEPERVMLAAARLLGEHLAVDRCAYADIEADEDTMNLAGDYTRTPNTQSIVGRLKFSDFGAEVLRLMREDRPYVVNDVDTHEPPVENLRAYRATQIQAVICVPLHKGGRFVAAMAVHSATPRRWRSDEVELVRAVAARCWESIERGRVMRELREAGERFRFLAESMPQKIFTARPTGEVDYFNQQWMQFTGLSLDQIRNWDWTHLVHPDDLDQNLRLWERSIETGEPFYCEHRFRRADGEYRWHVSRAHAMRDEAGRVLMWIGSNTEIHDLKHLADERALLLQAEREARAEAEHAGRMKDEFLTTLSHELRTPLNAIYGWSQMLLRAGDHESATLRQGLETIERNARAQTQLIEDLLDMSRIVSGTLRMDVQRVALAPIIETAVDTVRHAADAKGVRVKTVLDSGAGPVNGDPNRLQQVFWNLLSNAIKFTPKGGRVQVVLERVDSNVEVSVADNGEGIVPEFLPHVFDRFRQANASTTRLHGGLGLGLSIVKHLVELHGGSIRAESSGKGQGSTFTVSLPITAIRLESGTHETKRRHTMSASSDLGLSSELCAKVAGVRVLVVDDEPDARELVRCLLGDCGALVTTAASANEAIERVISSRPDVLVSDIGMPEEDGYTLLKRLRALAPTDEAQIPAIALTAYARAEDRVRSVLAGYQMHVSKPVEPAELIAAVASLAGRA